VPKPVPVPCLPGQQIPLDGSALATAPTVGQHGSEILVEHGFSAAEIAALTSSNVVGR
jgi:crotonobetainyl-CoA:carnitine CoA-transferase CaiB-like acyl-CoA transferase